MRVWTEEGVCGQGGLDRGRVYRGVCGWGWHIPDTATEVGGTHACTWQSGGVHRRELCGQGLPTGEGMCVERVCGEGDMGWAKPPDTATETEGMLPPGMHTYFKKNMILFNLKQVGLEKMRFVTKTQRVDILPFIFICHSFISSLFVVSVN